MHFRRRQLTKSIDITRRKMSFVSKRFPTKCTEQGIQLLKNKLSRQMERVPCGKTHKYLVNREYRCFCPSNVVTKWRVLTSRVAFVWRSNIFPAGLPKNFPILCLSKIDKISKIIKNPKNIRFAVEQENCISKLLVKLCFFY